MKNSTKRLLLFVFALPALVALVVFFPYYNHIGVNLLLVCISIIASIELMNMFIGKGLDLKWGIVMASAALTPILAYCISLNLLPKESLFIAFYLYLLVIFFMAINPGKSQFKNTINKIGAYLTLLLYPGFFISYIVRLTSLPNATLHIIVFMLLVFLNDSNAWLIGVLFGKDSRNVFEVSPNKSLVGFIGGVLASIIVCIAATFLFPEVYQSRWIPMIALGLCASVTTIAGDLVESAIKRSAGVKDSGNIIMGRGGMLDSIDSLLFTAPLFYYFLSFVIYKT